MKETEKQLYEVSFCFTFEEKFIIDEKLNPLLNSIKIYTRKGINDSEIGKQVDYDIRVINGKKTIYPLSDSNKYVGFLNRIVCAYKMEIKAEDYIQADNVNGDYVFIIGEDNI